MAWIKIVFTNFYTKVSQYMMKNVCCFIKIKRKTKKGDFTSLEDINESEFKSSGKSQSQSQYQSQNNVNTSSLNNKVK